MNDVKSCDLSTTKTTEKINELRLLSNILASQYDWFSPTQIHEKNQQYTEQQILEFLQKAERVGFFASVNNNSQWVFQKRIDFMPSQTQ